MFSWDDRIWLSKVAAAVLIVWLCVTVLNASLTALYNNEKCIPAVVDKPYLKKGVHA